MSGIMSGVSASLPALQNAPRLFWLSVDPLSLTPHLRMYAAPLKSIRFEIIPPQLGGGQRGSPEVLEGKGQDFRQETKAEQWQAALRARKPDGGS